ncbi:MAG: hypothetical protein J7L66_04590 [Anaerolineaceae bacterium]|nr:hypothetical protein [Anaerolineaceae bacterium]
MRGHRESRVHIQAARIALHQRIKEYLNFIKSHNLVKLAVNFRPPHSLDCTVEVYVLRPQLIQGGIQRPHSTHDSLPVSDADIPTRSGRKAARRMQ